MPSESDVDLRVLRKRGAMRVDAEHDVSSDSSAPWVAVLRISGTLTRFPYQVRLCLLDIRRGQGAFTLKFGALRPISPRVTPGYSGSRLSPVPTQRASMSLSRIGRVRAAVRLLPSAPIIGFVVVLNAMGLGPAGAARPS